MLFFDHAILFLDVVGLGPATVIEVNERVSADSAPTQANGTWPPQRSPPTGRFVAFESIASNLVASDTNAAADVFVHWRPSNRPPSVPVLLEPGDGQVFFFGKPEVFAVNSVDPDGDLYSAIVTVTNVDTGDITMFQRRPTASGTDSRGGRSPRCCPVPTVGADGRVWAGDPSGERAFEVQ